MSSPQQHTEGVSSPSYCPKCQRLYRRAPSGYRCIHDGTPLIDAGDPIPSAWSGEVISLGVTLTTLAAAVGLSLTLM